MTDNGQKVKLLNATAAKKLLKDFPPIMVITFPAGLDQDGFKRASLAFKQKFPNYRTFCFVDMMATKTTITVSSVIEAEQTSVKELAEKWAATNEAFNKPMIIKPPEKEIIIAGANETKNLPN